MGGPKVNVTVETNDGRKVVYQVRRADPTCAAELATAGQEVARWTSERDRLIRQAVAAGGSLREVGALAGLSHTAVKLICERAASGEGQ